MNEESHPKPQRLKIFVPITNICNMIYKVIHWLGFWLVQALSLWYKSASLGFSGTRELLEHRPVAQS
jgi:hypothetical protein